jgi:hypothetical protein
MRLIDIVGRLNFETPGDAGGGGSSDGNVGASANEGAKPAAAGGQGTGATGNTGQGGQTANPWDAEKRGILGDLQKERTARQRYEREYATAQAELASERRRVQALAGVNPRSEQEVLDDQVSARLRQLNVPRSEKLANLSDEQIDRLLRVADNADNFEATINQQWKSLATRMMDSAVTEMSKVMGGDLTERQQTKLKTAYYNAAASDPNFLARHEAGDPKLVQEFVKEFVEDFVEPGRRKALSDEQNRMRRVPSSRDRSVVGNSGKKVDLSKDDEFADAAAAAFKAHGGAFGGRD